MRGVGKLGLPPSNIMLLNLQSLPKQDLHLFSRIWACCKGDASTVFHPHPQVQVTRGRVTDRLTD